MGGCPVREDLRISDHVAQLHLSTQVVPEHVDKLISLFKILESRGASRFLDNQSIPSLAGACGSPRRNRFRQGSHTARVVTMMSRHDRLRFMDQGSSAARQTAVGLHRPKHPC